MNRIFATALAVACMGAVPAVAQAHGGESSPYDSVVGLGKNGGVPVNSFGVAVRGDANGANPVGNAFFLDTVNSPARAFAGPVVCMSVVGNRATVVFRSTYNLNQGGFFDGDIMTLEDNGVAGRSGPVDKMINARLTPAQTQVYAANGCPAPIAPSSKISVGDIAIHDGT
jgi:hypothetical protein